MTSTLQRLAQKSEPVKQKDAFRRNALYSHQLQIAIRDGRTAHKIINNVYYTRAHTINQCLSRLGAQTHLREARGRASPSTREGATSLTRCAESRGEKAHAINLRILSHYARVVVGAISATMLISPWDNLYSWRRIGFGSEADYHRKGQSGGAETLDVNHGRDATYGETRALLLVSLESIAPVKY